MNHKQIINEAASAIAKVAGWDVNPDHDFVSEAEKDWKTLKSREFQTHARSGDFLKMAEAAFAAITGDKPDYNGDD